MQWSFLALPSLLLALAGCGTKYTLADLDGDGYNALEGDCWDAIAGPDGGAVGGADIYPGAAEVWYDGIDENCDGAEDDDQDGDTYPLGKDCDDTDASIFPGAPDTWYDGVDTDCAGNDDDDQDGDAYPRDEDCDDTDASIFPGAPDTWYDGVDSDCAGDNDNDQDGDSYPLGEDCDDADPTRYPDAPIEEIWYNGIDENCDGNDGDKDGDGYVIETYAYDWTLFSDHVGDGDCWDDPDTTPAGYTSGVFTADEVNPDADETWYDNMDQDCGDDNDFDADGDGAESDAVEDAIGVYGDDCDDTDASVHPGATDTWYDGVDTDCGGEDDYDADGDTVELTADCDDTDDTVFPGAEETCADLDVDRDCDGDYDDPDATDCTYWYTDADTDGYGGTDKLCLCVATATYSAVSSTDCDDSDATVLDYRNWYTDGDGDGYGVTLVQQCDAPPNGVAIDNDCDDANADINPSETEKCDDTNTDEDCDGYTDDGDDSVDPATKLKVYTDADSDGYGAAEVLICDPGSGQVTNDLDCDDGDAAISPSATETVGDGIDEDCDGAEICYADADGDGVRVSDTTVSSTKVDCSARGTALASAPSDDCDDANFEAFPGATEIVGDAVDEDCDGVEVCYQDGDGDGVRTESTTASADADCGGAGEAPNTASADDCDDADPDVYPGALERCDSTDQDCDGAVLDVDEDGDGVPFSASALSLSRSDRDLLEVADSPGLDFGTGNWTVEAWVNATGFDAGTGATATVRLFDRAWGAASSDPSWALYLDDVGGYGFPRVSALGLHDGSLWDGATSSADAATAGSWFHLAVVVDMAADTATYYVDGRTSGPVALPSDYAGSDLSNDAPLLISSYPAPFDGQVDEIRIWDIARSEAEIADSMCRTFTGADTEFGDLILYLPLESDTADHGPNALGVAERGTPTLVADP